MVTKSNEPNESNNNKHKSSDYMGSVVSSNSGNLYSLKEFDIKKECLIEVILPLVEKVIGEGIDISMGFKGEPVDKIMEDRTGFGYLRRVQAEILPSGKIQLYDIDSRGQRKVLASEYNIVFDENRNIKEVTEDRDLENKHISVVYSIERLENDGRSRYKAIPKSVVLVTNIDNKERVKLFAGLGFDGKDLLKEIPFPNNFAHIITLRE